MNVDQVQEKRFGATFSRMNVVKGLFNDVPRRLEDVIRAQIMKLFLSR